MSQFGASEAMTPGVSAGIICVSTRLIVFGARPLAALHGAE
jgi:hypothetical protein